MKKIEFKISGHVINTRKHRMAFVSINSHRIRSNAKRGERKPVIRIALSQSDKNPRYAHEIAITGPSRLLYSPDESLLSCGARLVLVAPAETVEIINGPALRRLEARLHSRVTERGRMASESSRRSTAAWSFARIKARNGS